MKSYSSECIALISILLHPIRYLVSLFSFRCFPFRRFKCRHFPFRRFPSIRTRWASKIYKHSFFEKGTVISLLREVVCITYVSAKRF